MKPPVKPAKVLRKGRDERWVVDRLAPEPLVAQHGARQCISVSDFLQSGEDAQHIGGIAGRQVVGTRKTPEVEQDPGRERQGQARWRSMVLAW